MSDPARTPEEFFAADATGLAAYRIVHETFAAWGGCEERVGRSQVGFRRRRGFAWLWNPRQYLRNASADVVVTFALDHELDSPRVKQAVRTSPLHVVHHVEVRDPATDLDAELLGWLREAYDAAG
ncbi:MAG TPA: DUF5655 domain-containing protein [Nocardioides sp.]|nr:DUF5655 domain-containing protein [Nocardioides sp.]